MNVFGLSAVACPLAGAITGGVSVTTSGAIPAATGIALGLAVGLILYSATMAFIGLMLRWLGASAERERLNPLQSLASVASVFMPMVTPFASWALATFLISRLLPL